MGVGGCPVESLSDEALLTGFAAGDVHLSAAFVRRFQRRVFGTAIAVLAHDVRLAEDATQQAFERAWRHASVYDARRGTVGAWLGRIAHNVAVDLVRARRASPIDPSELDVLLQAITATPERAVLRAESGAELRATIAKLPVAQARALLMAAYWGMTAQEIADVQNVPLGTAKTRIRAAMQKLRQALDRGSADGASSATPINRSTVRARGPRAGSAAQLPADGEE